MSVVGEKASIRAAVLARRADVPEGLRQAFASRLAEAGLALTRAFAKPSGTIVSAYRPIRGEAETAPLLDALAHAGHATALPVTRGRGHPLRFHLWRPGDPLAPGPWNIPEPSADAPPVDPDILFVPLAAFDRRGFRLGYGAGFYDNALVALRGRKPILAIGVAYGLQEVAAIPREPHDQGLDAIVTEDETIMVGPG